MHLNHSRFVNPHVMAGEFIELLPVLSYHWAWSPCCHKLDAGQVSPIFSFLPFRLAAFSSQVLFVFAIEPNNRGNGGHFYRLKSHQVGII